MSPSSQMPQILYADLDAVPRESLRQYDATSCCETDNHYLFGNPSILLDDDDKPVGGFVSDASPDCHIETIFRDLESLRERLSLVRGNYAFVAVLQGVLIAARSHDGLRPLYRAKRAGTHVAFSSDPSALFAFGQVSQLAPGRFLCGAEEHDIPHEDPEVVVMKTLVRSAVCMLTRRMPPETCGVLLSGGSGSAALSEATDRNLMAFTLSYAAGASRDELGAAALDWPRRQATQFTLAEAKMRLREIVSTCGSCEVDVIRETIAWYMLAKKVSDLCPDIRVVLSGHRTAPELARRAFAAHGIELRAPLLDRSVTAMLRLCEEEAQSSRSVNIVEGCGFDYLPDLQRFFGIPTESDFYKRTFQDVFPEAAAVSTAAAAAQTPRRLREAEETRDHTVRGNSRWTVTSSCPIRIRGRRVVTSDDRM